MRVKLLEGLPPYGPPANAFPAQWGQLAREGVVVEFQTETDSWKANFQPGLSGVTLATRHPNARDAVVIANGDLWVVDVLQRSAVLTLLCVEAILEVEDGWVLSRQGLALARLGPEGLMWHTRRLSWDGFDQLSIVGGEVTGIAFSPLDDGWHPFRVDLSTGRSAGGSYGAGDDDGWERLCDTT